MFAKIAFVDSQGETEHRCEQQILDPVQACLQGLEAGDSLGKVSHRRRPAQFQQEDGDAAGIEEIPE